MEVMTHFRTSALVWELDTSNCILTRGVAMQLLKQTQIRTIFRRPPHKEDRFLRRLTLLCIQKNREMLPEYALWGGQTEGAVL